jgi:hypothetical protein
MSDDTKKTPASKEPSLQESVAAKIKSRSSKPVILDGRASRFDLRRYGDHDFSAGGQLQARFVAKSDDRIQQCMSEGYDFPKEWDARLPNLETSGLVLMLRSKQHAAEAKDWHLKNAEQLDRSKAPSDAAKSIAPDKREGAEFMHHGPEKPVQVTLGDGAKTRVMGPE